jgi:hypothetical protein
MKLGMREGGFTHETLVALSCLPGYSTGSRHRAAAHADTDPQANTDPQADTDAHPDADADRDTDAHPHADADRDTDAHPDADHQPVAEPLAVDWADAVPGLGQEPRWRDHARRVARQRQLVPAARQEW